ncbi:MAG: hypothetical protein JWN86_1513 [Planctomycetota bacterium]|nr:hypothetical protein [Planctomycetota bacterium]
MPSNPSRAIPLHALTRVRTAIRNRPRRLRPIGEALEARLCLSAFYDTQVIAATGSATTFNFTHLGKGPSINDAGYVAFQAESGNNDGKSADNLYAYRPADASLQQLMNSVFMYPNERVLASPPGTGAIDGDVQINNKDEVIARRRLNASVQVGFPFGSILTAPLTYLETWNADAANPPGLPSSVIAEGVPAAASAPLWFFLNPATGGTYPSKLNVGSPYDAIYPNYTLNDSGQANFSAIVRGRGDNQIASNTHDDLVARGGLGAPVVPVHPMLSNERGSAMGSNVLSTAVGRIFVESWDLARQIRDGSGSRPGRGTACAPGASRRDPGRPTP